MTTYEKLGQYAATELDLQWTNNNYNKPKKH